MRSVEQTPTEAADYAATVLAASAGNDALQAASSLLCARADAARDRSEPPKPFEAPRRAA